jgi:hypothetical protein
LRFVSKLTIGNLALIFRASELSFAQAAQDEIV